MSTPARAASALLSVLSTAITGQLFTQTIKAVSSSPFTKHRVWAKLRLLSRDNSPQTDIADSNSKNTVSFHPAHTTKRFSPPQRTSNFLCSLLVGRDCFRCGFAHSKLCAHFPDGRSKRFNLLLLFRKL